MSNALQHAVNDNKASGPPNTRAEGANVYNETALVSAFSQFTDQNKNYNLLHFIIFIGIKSFIQAH